MLSYLSKKIAVPHNLAVEVVSWNAGQGWLAIGGENGFLKVLKLDGSTTDDSSSNNNNDFSSTQTLEGHQHSIRVIVWNENFRKLTTSDAKGLIIVWSMNQGAWFEEMVNNRNRSVVTDMRWSKDGQRICIVIMVDIFGIQRSTALITDVYGEYEDGAVIVGTVDGQRLWGKEIDKKLSQVEWLPDCKGLIFGTFDGEIQIYDSEGIFSHRVHAACLDSNQAPRIQPSKQVAPPNIGIASIEWWGSSDVTVSLHALEKHAALAAAESAARMIGERHLVSCAPNLCIAFRNGKAQLMRGIQDDQPILLDTGINILGAEWSPSGHTIAIAGISECGGLDDVSSHRGSSEALRGSGVVRIYSSFGQLLSNQLIPSLTGRVNGLRSLSWEGSGARIALAVDSYIYLSTIKTERLWGHFNSGTLLFVQQTVTRSSPSWNQDLQTDSKTLNLTEDACTVTFWDTEKDRKYVKSIRDVVAVATCSTSEVCAIFTAGLSLENPPSASSLTPTASLQFVIRLYNGVGAPVEVGRNCPLVPKSVAMTQEYLLVASDDEIYLWNFGKAPAVIEMDIDKGYISFGGTIRKRSESMRHVDDYSLGVAAGVDSYTPPSGMNKIKDPIIDVAIARDGALFICRSSGIIHQYTSLTLSLQGSFNVDCRPQNIAVNCEATRLSVVDEESHLHVFELLSPQGGSSSVVVANALSRGERREIWQMKWAADQPDLLAIMEKSRMYILRSMKPEEPVTSEAYIYEFSDLQIKGIVLDNLLRPMHSSSTSQKPVDRIKDVVEGSDAFAGTVPGNWQNHLVICDTKTLRDTRDMLSKLSNMKDAFSYVEANPHKRLWRLLAESALEKSDVSVAEKAFVKLSSYSEIRLCRRLEDLDGSVKRLAEISAVYFRSFDNAEALYLEIDRHDLAVDLRLKLGDWFRVVQLLQPDDTSRVGYPEDGNSTRKPGSSPRFGSQKNLLKQAYVECGNYYAKRGRWNLAAQCFLSASAGERLVVAYTALEDFDSLYQTISHETDSAIHLRRDVARALLSIGHVERAVNLLVGLGDIPTAVEECIISNHWSKALELAADHKLLEVDKLLGKYAVHFVENHQIFSAVELYHRAGKHVEAAQLLVQLAVDNDRGQTGFITLTAHQKKKLHLLSALEVESHRRKSSRLAPVHDKGFIPFGLDEELVNTGLLDSHWRGCEGLHLYAKLAVCIPVSRACAARHAESIRDNFGPTNKPSIIHHDTRYMLCHRQLFSEKAQLAVKTASRLAELFEDIVGYERSWSLLAIAAFQSKRFALCSRALMKLEGAEDISPHRKGRYSELASAIFTKYPPRDPPMAATLKCPHSGCSANNLHELSCSCAVCHQPTSWCVATGEPIFSESKNTRLGSGGAGAIKLFSCRVCAHETVIGEGIEMTICALCHAPVV